MMRNGHHQILKLETRVLKVNINCEGCKEKVRKLLKKIEGVYSVEINTEKQEVIVSGSVDPPTLLKKLVKCSKKAELCPPKSNHKLKQASTNQIQFLPNDLTAVKNPFMFPPSFASEMGNLRSFEKFQNQGIGMKAIDTGIDNHDLITARRMGNLYLDEDMYATNDGWEDDDMPSLTTDGDYLENGSLFPGLGGHQLDGVPNYYKHNNLAPLMMNSRQQQGQYVNFPSSQMNFLHRQDGHVNINHMANDIFMHQPPMMNHAFSMSPPYAAPHSYY